MKETELSLDTPPPRRMPVYTMVGGPDGEGGLISRDFTKHAPPMRSIRMRSLSGKGTISGWYSLT